MEEEEALTTEIQQADKYRESIHCSGLRPPSDLPRHLLAKVELQPCWCKQDSILHVHDCEVPRLKLKEFARDLTQWTPFWESFQARVSFRIFVKGGQTHQLQSYRGVRTVVILKCFFIHKE